MAGGKLDAVNYPGDDRPRHHFLQPSCLLVMVGCLDNTTSFGGFRIDLSLTDYPTKLRPRDDTGQNWQLCRVSLQNRYFKIGWLPSLACLTTPEA